jgi:hypothetical protein
MKNHVLACFARSALVCFLLCPLAAAQDAPRNDDGYPYVVRKPKHPSLPAITPGVRELGADTLDAIDRLDEVVSTRSEVVYREREAEAKRYASKLHRRALTDGEKDLDRHLGTYLMEVGTCRLEWQSARASRSKAPDCSGAEEARTAAWRLLQVR